MAGRSSQSTSSTKTTACGLPTFTQVTDQSVPPISIGWPMNSGVSASTGIFAEANSGRPMQTRTDSTLPSATFSHRVLTPAPVSTSMTVLSVMPCSYTYLATQRMPLPHISPAEPSALYISMRKSALSEGQMQMSPSPPTPKCRSETYRARAGRSSTVSSKQLT